MSLQFQPMPLLKRRSPFDDPNWIFELKYDGFRALAVIERARAQLLSRNAQFKNLLFRRGNPPCFFAFDLLTCDGRDLRTERLLDRKQELRRLLARSPDSLLKYTEYIDGCGTVLFERICELDLEGVVAKQKFGPYVTEREHSTWYKILNREYSQIQGREELFERERHSEPVAGWHVCALACEARGD